MIPTNPLIPAVNLFGIATPSQLEVSVTARNVNNVFAQDIIGIMPNVAGLDRYSSVENSGASPLEHEGCWRGISKIFSYLWNLEFIKPSEESIRGLSTQSLILPVSTEILGEEIEGKDKPLRPTALLGFQIVSGGIDPPAACGSCTGDAEAEILVFPDGKCL